MARPSKLTEAVRKKTADYIKNYKKCGDPVPTAAGLACELGVARSSLYKWAETDGSFSDMLGKIQTVQERGLISGALEGELNANISKLMLAKHGYHDKAEVSTDITSGGEKITEFAMVPLTSES